MRSVLALLSILVALLGHANGQSINASGGIGPVPAQAAAAGFNALTFNNTFSPSSMDTTGTYNAGYNWYLANFFNAAAAGSAITFNADGSATYLANASTNATWQTSSAALKVEQSPAAGWVGMAFGGGGYFEATFKFDPNFNNMLGYPAWWSMAIEHLANLPSQQWVGQAAGYSHFAELDFIEYDTGNTNNYNGAYPEWYGINTVTCPPGYCRNLGPVSLARPQIVGTNYNVYHTYGLLWIPSTVSTSGSVTWYFDNVAVGSTITWTQFTNQSPPPASTWQFGVVDQQHMAINLGTGTTSPMTVKSARVWQASPTNNIITSTLNTLDSTATPVGINLSNGNLTAVGAASPTCASQTDCLNSLSVKYHTSGKFYAEVLANVSATGNSAIGVSNGTFPLSYLGEDTGSLGYFGNGGVCLPSAGCSSSATIGAYTTGSRIGAAVDLTNHKIWFTLNGTTWNNAAIGSQDPTMNIGGLAIPTTGHIFFAVEPNSVGESFTVNFGPTFTYSIPSGFSAW